MNGGPVLPSKKQWPGGDSRENRLKEVVPRVNPSPHQNGVSSSLCASDSEVMIGRVPPFLALPLETILPGFLSEGG